MHWQRFSTGDNKLMMYDTEVLIIGAGAVGVCCAHYLREAGKEVMLIDKGDVCSGASYGNAGLIVPSYSMPLPAPGVIAQSLKWLLDRESPFYIKPSLRPSLLRWMWKFICACNVDHVKRSIPVLRDLTLESLRLFKELNSLEGMDFCFEQKGIVELFRTRDGFEEGKWALELLRSFGIKGELLDEESLAQWVNGMCSKIAGAIAFYDDASMIPDRFVKQLVQYETKHGLELRAQTRVVGFKKSMGRITTVHTTRGEICAREVVIAAGAWSPLIARNLGVKLVMEPAKGFSITYRRAGHFLERPVSLAEARVVITPMVDMVRFAGILELVGFDDSISINRIRGMQKAVTAYFPEFDFKDMELIEIWHGFRPCSADGLPYIGRPRRWRNLVIATGHGMLGLSQAPATGKLVAQILSGEKPFVDLRLFRIERAG